MREERGNDEVFSDEESSSQATAKDAGTTGGPLEGSAPEVRQESLARGGGLGAPTGYDVSSTELEDTQQDLAIPMAKPPGIRQGTASTGEAPGETSGGGQISRPGTMAPGGAPELTGQDDRPRTRPGMDADGDTDEAAPEG